MTCAIQQEAADDIIRHIERYAAQNLPPVARRFHAAVLVAIDALTDGPESGSPKALGDPCLALLRAWPVKGFDEFWVYYLAGRDAVTVLRVLHTKRDIEAAPGRAETKAP